MSRSQVMLRDRSCKSLKNVAFDLGRISLISMLNSAAIMAAKAGGASIIHAIDVFCLPKPLENALTGWMTGAARNLPARLQ